MSDPHTHAPACSGPNTPLAGVRAGIDACVHCGFCLPSCPTYLALEDENDSPRGRIMLMRTVLEGGMSIDDPTFGAHMDRCLGCRACETACPSGVPYGHLLEAARATINTARPLPLMARLVLAVFARPSLLRPTMAIARLLRASKISRALSHLPGRAGFAFAMLDVTRPLQPAQPYAPATVPMRGRVALLDGCVMRELYAETNRATARVLGVNGYQIAAAPGQGCCGALHAHAGDLEGARGLARANIAAFEASGAEFVGINSAGCGAMCKEYGHLLADDPKWAERAAAVAARVRDVSELLVAAGPVAATGAPMRVAYDAPCHLLHAQRIAEAPLRVLASIKGLELVPLIDADRCCGSAGIYGLLQPRISSSVLDPKLRNIAASGADCVATGNPGCLMQIGAGIQRAGMACRVVHPVDLLDAAYAVGQRADSHAE